MEECVVDDRSAGVFDIKEELELGEGECCSGRGWKRTIKECETFSPTLTTILRIPYHHANLPSFLQCLSSGHLPPVTAGGVVHIDRLL